MFSSPLDEAKTLIMRGQIDPAVSILSRELNEEFFDHEKLFLLGGCFLAKGLNGLAAVVTSAAIDAARIQGRPATEALTNLGAAYRQAHNYEPAERIWVEALKHEKRPDKRSQLLSNMSTLFVQEACPEKAIEWCERALAEDPNNHAAHANLGIANLELCNWKQGWEGWLHTRKTGDRESRNYGVPEWDGSPGKTVIVWGDQGIGDEIFFASCLPDMQRVCKRVILDCHPRLPELFARSFPEIEVHGDRKVLTPLEWLPGCGAEASICLADLPYHFRNTDASWGDGGTYLKAGDHAVPMSGKHPRIGLSWTGGTPRTRTDRRSLSLELLEPIIRARPDAEWFSLQYTEQAARDVCILEERTGTRIAHYPGWVECFEYDRTASFVASLDLLITVCTTVHHLGGALGIPTWTLVPACPSWRYGIKGERLPWYASARLYRQDGDVWPINRIVRDLADFA